MTSASTEPEQRGAEHPPEQATAPTRLGSTDRPAPGAVSGVLLDWTFIGRGHPISGRPSRAMQLSRPACVGLGARPCLEGGHSYRVTAGGRLSGPAWAGTIPCLRIGYASWRVDDILSPLSRRPVRRVRPCAGAASGGRSLAGKRGGLPGRRGHAAPRGVGGPGGPPLPLRLAWPAGTAVLRRRHPGGAAASAVDGPARAAAAGPIRASRPRALGRLRHPPRRTGPSPAGWRCWPARADRAGGGDHAWQRPEPRPAGQPAGPAQPASRPPRDGRHDRRLAQREALRAMGCSARADRASAHGRGRAIPVRPGQPGPRRGCALRRSALAGETPGLLLDAIERLASGRSGGLGGVCRRRADDARAAATGRDDAGLAAGPAAGPAASRTRSRRHGSGPLPGGAVQPGGHAGCRAGGLGQGAAGAGDRRRLGPRRGPAGPNWTALPADPSARRRGRGAGRPGWRNAERLDGDGPGRAGNSSASGTPGHWRHGGSTDCTAG